jgi:hypothetical protein
MDFGQSTIQNMLHGRRCYKVNVLLRGSEALDFIDREIIESFVNGCSEANQALSPTLSSWTAGSNLCDIYSMGRNLV